MEILKNNILKNIEVSVFPIIIPSSAAEINFIKEQLLLLLFPQIYLTFKTFRLFLNRLRISFNSIATIICCVILRLLTLCYQVM